MARRSKKLDMKSSQTVMKQRCRELGLVVYGDKQALLARIVNEENRLTTDRQVKDSDTDQKMLCTFKGTESLPIMDNMPCQQRQAEITAETKGDFERCSELRQWYKTHSGECPRRNSGDKTERTLAQWPQSKKARRARALNNTPSGRKLTASETAHLNNIIATQRPKMPLTKDHFERCNELRQWCLSHSGERPRIRSDDKTEASLAIWLHRALIRRNRAFSTRPSMRQLTASETAHLNSIVRATVTPPQLGCQRRPGLLDTKSSWSVLRDRCRELGLTYHGDKQAVLARISNEENSLTTDSQVKDSDNDQEMLGTEIIAETPFKRPRTLTPTP